MAVEISLELATLQAAVSRWFIGETRQGFFATDTEFRIVVWNRWMEMRSGFAAADVMGRSLFEVYPEATDRGIQEYYDEALAGHITVISHGLHRYLLPMPSTNPELGYRYMPQSGHIGPLFDDTRVIGVVTILEDVSDRVASETELRKQVEAQHRARMAAERALRAKDDFLSTLSHEMRTPLNAVLGWARLLKGRDSMDAELIDRAVAVIERNASAQAKMIDDMLDMARIVAGKLRLDMQPADLVSVVLAALDVVMPAATAKEITVRTKIDPKTPRVLGDPDRLQQMAWNLLSNAVKFTASGGSIEVSVQSDGRFVRLIVSDSGQGISPEFLPYVFDRFRQDDSSSARRHGGLGLGLALVRELASLHGGRVTAVSDGQDKGATFTIDLPTALSPEPPKSHFEPAATGAAAKSLLRIRVFLVDDDHDARELAAVALEESGAEVRSMSSGADALAAIADCSGETFPHVLVSDIGMPGQDGYSFIRELRALPLPQAATVPALAVTGYATRDDVERTIAAGFQRHVSKPIDPSALVSAVADLVKYALSPDEP